MDVNAKPEQREALLKIMSGQDTDPFATMFAVFASTFDKVHDPVFTAIDFDVDVEQRRGKARADGVFELAGDPIRNPVTGAEHRARIELPQGFEYEVAEIGSGTGRSQGKISLDLKGSHAHFARLHMNNKGLVRQRAAA